MLLNSHKKHPKRNLEKKNFQLNKKVVTITTKYSNIEPFLYSTIILHYLANFHFATYFTHMIKGKPSIS